MSPIRKEVFADGWRAGVKATLWDPLRARDVIKEGGEPFIVPKEGACPVCGKEET